MIEYERLLIMLMTKRFIDYSWPLKIVFIASMPIFRSKFSCQIDLNEKSFVISKETVVSIKSEVHMDANHFSEVLLFDSCKADINIEIDCVILTRNILRGALHRSLECCAINFLFLDLFFFFLLENVINRCLFVCCGESKANNYTTTSTHILL